MTRLSAAVTIVFMALFTLFFAMLMYFGDREKERAHQLKLREPATCAKQPMSMPVVPRSRNIFSFPIRSPLL